MERFLEVAEAFVKYVASAIVIFSFMYAWMYFGLITSMHGG